MPQLLLALFTQPAIKRYPLSYICCPAFLPGRRFVKGFRPVFRHPLLAPTPATIIRIGPPHYQLAPQCTQRTSPLKPNSCNKKDSRPPHGQTAISYFIPYCQELVNYLRKSQSTAFSSPASSASFPYCCHPSSAPCCLGKL